MKKILLALGAVAAVTIGVVAVSAFEAHIVNVTAKIENALKVEPDKIQFGTVFPQEYVVKPLKIALSSSFKEEPSADDVNYKIIQKPKCVKLDDTYVPVDSITHQCPTGATMVPPLCKWLSKLPDGTPPNDSGVSSPHPWQWPDPAGTNPVALGLLLKDNPNTTPKEIDYDVEDIWKIDLRVPCFTGMCEQGYQGPTLPPADEGKVFGCDLWIEVTGISRYQCGDGIDNDNDGAIDYPMDNQCSSSADNNEAS